MLYFFGKYVRPYQFGYRKLIFHSVDLIDWQRYLSLQANQKIQKAVFELIGKISNRVQASTNNLDLNLFLCQKYRYIISVQNFYKDANALVHDN